MWRNIGYLRQSIEKKDEGRIGLCVGLFFCLFLAVLLSGQMQLEQIRSTSGYMEDALAAAGLASALIDIREYGSTHVVRIPDADIAYEQYLKALKGNLGLDDNMECANKSLISGMVKVEKYIVYNVRDGFVYECKPNDGKKEVLLGEKGEVSAPNGQFIEHTGVYSEISFPFCGMFGMKTNAHKGKLVDVVGAS